MVSNQPSSHNKNHHKKQKTTQKGKKSSAILGWLNFIRSGSVRFVHQSTCHFCFPFAFAFLVLNSCIIARIANEALSFVENGRANQCRCPGTRGRWTRVLQIDPEWKFCEQPRWYVSEISDLAFWNARWVCQKIPKHASLVPPLWTCHANSEKKVAQTPWLPLYLDRIARASV